MSSGGLMLAAWAWLAVAALAWLIGGKDLGILAAALNANIFFVAAQIMKGLGK